MKQIIKTEDLNKVLVDSLKIELLEKNVYKIHSEEGFEIMEVLEFNALTKELMVRHNHTVHQLVFKRPVDLMLDQLGIKPAVGVSNKNIKAPMPGKVLEIMVQEGDSVEKGASILVLEAMKMENVLKAESNGIVKRVMTQQNKNVEKNQILVELDLTD